MKLPKGIELHGSHLRLSFYFNRKRYRESLGLEPNKRNIKFAENKLASIKYEISVGTFDFSKHFPNSKNATSNYQHNKTISEISEEWLSLKSADIRSSTLKKYRDTMRVILNLYGPNRSVKTLSVRSIDGLRMDIMKGRTSRTTNTYLAVLSYLLQHAHKYGYTKEDFSQLKYVKTTQQEINPFNIDEVNRVIAACRFDQHKNMLTLMAYTGMRTGELCALAWEDIDLVKGTALIRRSVTNNHQLKTTKTDKERIIYLLPPAIEALKSQKLATFMRPAKEVLVELTDKTNRTEIISFVFNPSDILSSSSKSDVFLSTTVNKIWREASRRAGVQYRSVYNLRHTYASWMLTSGVNISYLAKQMGHSNFMMIAKVYGRWMDDSSLSESEKAWSKMQENILNRPNLAPEISYKKLSG